jgi:hypothetical protein
MRSRIVLFRVAKELAVGSLGRFRRMLKQTKPQRRAAIVAGNVNVVLRLINVSLRTARDGLQCFMGKRGAVLKINTY